MAKIRVGLIGLGKSADFLGPGVWGIVAHLRSIQALPDYEIVAVANSSVESARQSIESHGLPAGTRAYGNPEDMASDPDVDLVVVSVVVTKHFDLVKPALEAKKNVFVEWPLGASLAEAEALTKLAADNNVKAFVGLQGRAEPGLLRLREMLQSHEIGTVISTSVMVSGNYVPGDGWMKGAEYFLDFKSGGNEFTIFFGHFLDYFTQILGDFSHVQGLLKTQRPTIPLIDFSNGQVLDPAYRKTAPDHIFVQGTLENGAAASIAFRKPQSAVDNLGLRWIITGTEGEIELTRPEAPLQYDADETRGSWSLKLKKGKETNYREVDLSGLDDSPAASVKQPGTNTARLYQSFAHGGGLEATFESATKTHRLLKRIAESAGWELP